VGGKKIAGGPQQSDLLGMCDGRFNRAETLVRPGSYLDKNDTPVGIDHYQVYLAAPTGEIASECLEALSFQEPLTAFFAPLAEQLRVGQQLTFVQQISYIVLRISYLVTWRRCGCCVAGQA